MAKPPAKNQKNEAKGGEVVPLRPPRPCPNCGKTSDRNNYPFCSKRCADIDLNRWLSGSYAIPASEEEPPERDPRMEDPDSGR